MIKNFTLFFLFIVFPFYGQVLNTVVVPASKKQGSFKDCSLSSCNYFESTGDEISYSDGTGGASDTKNARYLFEHPGFNNDKIKKIILEISISKIFQSTAVDAGMSIKMPNSSCNSSIAWSGFINQQTLYSCNQNGTSIFQNGIGTGNTSATTFFLSIYDKNATGFIGQTINYFTPGSDSFTFSFHPLVGGVQIHSAKVHITYEGTAPVPVVPATPTLTATAASASSVSLTWNAVANATAYELQTCSNQQIGVVTGTSYLVSGLSASTNYGYKVRAINGTVSSAYSACKYATTLSDCSSAITSVTPEVYSYSQFSGVVTYNWYPVSQANFYRVYRCETNQLLAETTATQFTFTPKDLKPGESYSIKVIAVDYCSGGATYLSKTSACSYVHVVKCVSNAFPENAIYSTVNAGNVTLRWPHVYPYGNYVYQVFNCATLQMIGSTYETSLALGNLPVGTTSYMIRTKGCEASPVSALSSCYEVVIGSGLNKTAGSSALHKPEILTQSSSDDNAVSNDLGSRDQPGSLENGSALVVYPNPSEDYITVTIPKDFLGGQLALYDLYNKVIWKNDNIRASSETIELKHLPANIYFLSATIQGRTFISKVVKK
ncbi:fibronectin type III domain-containing protein [Flavobacterium sp. HTF]|uniref:fibronectin type III domain-containing protein n=1 Tax=Flavobacterium sp. HTF TaxID=2170732 RepID=UPI000D5CFB47|nr:T9SS type A sorting domain-containing protein [Flavobacterium sp. HTF]PWB20573.1 hypothetical protein DCO46_20710 [Flavobacterium sp. HTF]